MGNSELENMDTISTTITEGLRLLYEMGNYTASLLKKSADWYNKVLKPLQDVGKVIREKIANISEIASAVFKPIVVANNLGQHQYVVWEYIEPELVEIIYKSTNVNKTLRLMYEKNGYKQFYSLFQKCTDYLDGNNVRILSQAIDSFSIKNYDLCAIGITVVIDAELSAVTGNPSTNIKKRVEPLLEKLDAEEMLSKDEYSFFSLYLTVDETMKTFAASSHFDKDIEPTYINRHWTMHGRAKRRKTKLDCVKLLRLLYAIILLDNIAGEGEKN